MAVEASKRPTPPVIARIAFLGEGNGHGSRFSTISVPFQS
jgi:hypothetical protein